MNDEELIDHLVQTVSNYYVHSVPGSTWKEHEKFIYEFLFVFQISILNVDSIEKYLLTDSSGKMTHEFIIELKKKFR